jgi:RNA polymerase sigma-70 factor (ECF subfamily)
MLGVTVAERVGPSGVRLRIGGSAADAAAADFRALVDADLDASYRLAAVILRDPTEAEDAVHDAVVVAWRSWSQLRDPAAAPAWFRRILINGCRDRLRRRKRRSLLEILRPPTLHEEPTTPDPSLDSVARQALRATLLRLSPDERVVISLRFGEDMTVPAIAVAIGIPEGTVKSRLHSATLKLRAELAEESW